MTTVNPEVAKAAIRIELVHWNSLYEHGQFKAWCPVDDCDQTFLLSDQENDRAIRRQVETHIHAVHEVSREEIVELLKSIKSAVETMATRLVDLEERVDGIKTVPVRGGFRVVVPETLASLLRKKDVRRLEAQDFRWLAASERECEHWECDEPAVFSLSGCHGERACEKHVLELYEEYSGD